MARMAGLVDVLVEHQVDAERVIQICADLMHDLAGGMTHEEMYRDLMANARDAGAVDTMLYQLEGDARYAENAALIVLSAAWNFPELEEPIRALGAEAAASPRSMASVQVANSILYGMYLIARAGAKIREVAYADDQGRIHLRQFDGTVDAGELFDNVRDQYGDKL